MSSEAVTWAFSVSVKPSGLKLTLLALAHYHHHQRREAWASAAIVAAATDQNIKTVEANMAELERRGLIVDTGQRQGRTKRVKVYALALDALPKTAVANTPKIGGVSDGETPPKTGDLPTETPPKTGGLNSPKIGGVILQRDTSRERANALSVRASEEPDLLGEKLNGHTVPVEAITVKEVTAGWNMLATKYGLPLMKRLSLPRERLLQSRIFENTRDDWLEVFDNIKASPFLRGDNGKWAVTFDWLLEGGNFQKILEGNYNDKKVGRG